MCLSPAGRMGPSALALVHIYVMGSIPTAWHGRITKAPIRLLTRLTKVTMMGLTDRMEGEGSCDWLQESNNEFLLACIVSLKGFGLFFFFFFFWKAHYSSTSDLNSIKKITSNCKHCCIMALSKCVGSNTQIHALIIDPGRFNVERGVPQSAVR